LKVSVALDAVKRAAAALTDGLAAVGERMPGVQQLTVSVAGASLTVTPVPAPPAPPAPATCPTCHR